jgi:glutathionyl-hydroquinone reductase
VKAQFPAEQSVEGRFVRQGDAFRRWVRADGSTEFPAVPGRYHLYVSLACPWAHRTIIVRKLKRLEDAIGMTVVDPVRAEDGWAFREVPGASRDPVNGFKYLREAYLATDPNYRARVTVPVLWDKQTHQIVSNSDDDIMRMFETEFFSAASAGSAAPVGSRSSVDSADTSASVRVAQARGDIDLYPNEHVAEIDSLNEWIYETLNNGVYEAGFATSQKVYERAAYGVFETLDALEERLSRRRYLIAGHPVETDWRTFVTLVRFDAVYYGHFKCNLRRIVDYPNLWGYLRDLYQYDGVSETVNMDHIKLHYYYTHDDINPTRVVPIGPDIDFTTLHGRERLA